MRLNELDACAFPDSKSPLTYVLKKSAGLEDDLTAEGLMRRWVYIIHALILQIMSPEDS